MNNDNDKTINQDQMDSMWGIIKEKLFPSLEDEMIPRNKLDTAIKDALQHQKKVVFKKPRRDGAIKPGDVVVNKDNLSGIVIDVDDDRVCIELIDQSVEICKISEITKISG